MRFAVLHKRLRTTRTGCDATYRAWAENGRCRDCSGKAITVRSAHGTNLHDFITQQPVRARDEHEDEQLGEGRRHLGAEPRPREDAPSIVQLE